MNEQVTEYVQPAQPGDNSWWKGRNLANRTSAVQDTYTAENGPNSRSDSGRIIAVFLAGGSALTGCGLLAALFEHLEKSGGF